MVNRDEVIAVLDSCGVRYESEKHKAVFSIQKMEETGVRNPERIAKNLFLRDDKKRAYYLVSIRNDRIADLKELRTKLGSRPLSFASEEDLKSILNLGKGEVTPFGLLNDSGHKAVYIMDSFFSGGIIGIHPNDNTETVFLDSAALISVLSEHGTECMVLDFE